MLRFLLSMFCAATAVAAQDYSIISIPTRDGKALAADLYAGDLASPKPVVLVQTPYNRTYYRLATQFPAAAGGAFPYDSAKYNYVVVDWRGFYGSIAAAVPNYDRGLDGYDAVEWIAAQPWCNGKIGTWGESALAEIQFETAVHQPPHLICCAAFAKDFKTKYADFYYGGDYRKEHCETLDSLGLTTTSAILAHPRYDGVWQYVEQTSDHPELLSVPFLIVSGWFDHFPAFVIRAFHDIQTRGGTTVPLAKLVLGPWTHTGLGQLHQGELDFPLAVGKPDSMTVKFWEHYLLGRENGYESIPAVQYYQMGSDEWRSADSWNNVGTTFNMLYLAPGGSLNLVPPTTATIDSFISDPRAPSPSIGGSRFNPFDSTAIPGPLDVRSLSSRTDQLVYSTEALTREVVLDGGATVELYAAVDARDADLAVRLCDEFPDGRRMILTQGIVRGRFRLTPAVETLLVPDSIYHYLITLHDLGNTFRVGHKLVMIVSASDYPMFDVNPQSGDTLYQRADTTVARIRIYHDSAHTSRLTLPGPTQLAVDSRIGALPTGSTLDATIFPQPFFGRATVRVMLAVAANVQIELFDLLGRRALRIDAGRRGTGESFIPFDGASLLPGAYLLRVTAGSSSIRCMIVVGR